MALTADELATFTRLKRTIDLYVPDYQTLDLYYNGAQRLQAMGMAVPPELTKFTTIVNWPRTNVDALEERLDVEGFRLPDEDIADDDLWRVWQANNLDEESQLAHLDALIYGRSFICVGSNEADPNTPIVTVESPLQMTAEVDPRTRLVTVAARVYNLDEQDLDAGQPRGGTLYLPNVTIWLQLTERDWVEVDRDEHNLGVVPVVPLVNRARAASRGGESEMSDVIGLTDACARSLTNAQLAAESLAVPQRYVLGTTRGDFVDETGSPLPAWEAYFGAIWGLANENAKVGQFDAASLSNFETIVNLYARLVSGVTGLPMRYFGQNTANPPSADAIRADEARLIKRCERKQRPFSGSWEAQARLVRRLQSGEWDPSLLRMETLWRDPATPTVAQKADATMKLASTTVGGVPIMPLEMAREELGWSATKRQRAKVMDEETASDPVMLSLMRELNAPGASGAPVGG